MTVHFLDFFILILRFKDAFVVNSPRDYQLACHLQTCGVQLAASIRLAVHELTATASKRIRITDVRML